MDISSKETFVSDTTRFSQDQKNTRKVMVDKLGRSYGTGRRKSSVARVWIKSGTGSFVVNGMNLDKYFSREYYRLYVLQPFEATKTSGQFDVFCTVKGGGLSGQSGAIRHGVSRALDMFNLTYRPILRKESLLTRDSRVVERKKYGKHKARKSTQFSKR